MNSKIFLHIPQNISRIMKVKYIEIYEPRKMFKKRNSSRCFLET